MDVIKVFQVEAIVDYLGIINPRVAILNKSLKIRGRGEDYVKMKTEIRVMLLEAKETWSPPERKEAGKNSFLESLDGAWPYPYLGFRFLTSRAVRESFSIVCGIFFFFFFFYGSHRKQVQVLPNRNMKIITLEPMNLHVVIFVTEVLS